MQGGHDQPDDGTDLRVPEDGTPGSDPSDFVASADENFPIGTSPLLPHGEPKAPPPMTSAPTQVTRGAETWYRTDQERYKSVHRRANPWYRRIARGFVGAVFLTAAAVGLFFGAQLVQDYLDRDRLPSPGAEVPSIRTSSFEVRSDAPAPVLDGTLTLDTATRAFEFIGRGTGLQTGVQIVSPDGETLYIRRGSDSWQLATSLDQIATDAQRAVAYLHDDDTSDDILTNRLRRGYVDLIERTKIGEDDDQQIRYEMRFDTASFDTDFPLQYREFRDRAIPGVSKVRALPVTIWLDADDVLVRVDDDETNWRWERLGYSDEAFTPIDPVGDLLTSTIPIESGSLSNNDSDG